MSNTRIEGEVMYLGSEELSIILKSMLRGYRFLHDNTMPTTIVLPNITEIEGVKVEYESRAAQPVSKSRASRKSK